MRYVLPSFRPPQFDYQISTCKKWNLQYCKYDNYPLTDKLDKGQSLYSYDHCQTERIPGDGKCYLYTIMDQITGTRMYHKESRTILLRIC